MSVSAPMTEHERHHRGLVASLGRPALLVAAVAAVVGTAGIAAIPFYTRGEPREALVVREMYAGKGWVLPLRNGTSLPRKPPFFHWLAAGASLATGRVDETTMRLPSAAASTAAAVLVCIWAGAGSGAAVGLLAALVTITSFEWMRAATVARVDMVYTAWLVVALLALDRLVRGWGPAAAWRAVLWIAVAGATLTKGPIAIVLVSLAVAGIALVRRRTGVLGRVRPVRGLLLVGIVAGFWFGLALAQHGQALLNLVVRENVYHLMGSEAGGTGHAHGVAYLLAMGALGFLPWTPLLALAVASLRNERSDPGVQVASVWATTVICVHALASAKRGVYLLPAYPALALLLVRGIVRVTGMWSERILPIVARIYAGLGTTFALIVAALAWGVGVPTTVRDLLHPRDRAGLDAAVDAAGANAVFLTAAAAVIVAAMPFLLRAARARRFGDLVAAIAVVSAGSTVVFNNAIHPPIARARSLDTFMTSVRAVVRPEDPLYFVGGADHGAVFYAGRRLPSLAPGTLPPPGAYLLVWERDWIGRAARGELSQPLRVSATTAHGRGHLLLVTAPGPRPVAASPAARGP